MAIKNIAFVLSLITLIISRTPTASATVFNLENRCSYPVWPGTLTGNGGAALGGGGFKLAPGESTQIPAPPGWSGRFWGRTGCNFDDAGNGNCKTGNCGPLQCTGGGVPPVTLVEFTLGSNSNEKDFYDVSLVDGYNVGMGVRAMGGSGDCQYAGCVTDLNANCPAELQVVSYGVVIACRSACATFNKPEFCCSGEHATPDTCGPTDYSRMFKAACPTAYSYAYTMDPAILKQRLWEIHQAWEARGDDYEEEPEMGEAAGDADDEEEPVMEEAADDADDEGEPDMEIADDEEEAEEESDEEVDAIEEEAEEPDVDAAGADEEIEAWDIVMDAAFQPMEEEEDDEPDEDPDIEIGTDAEEMDIDPADIVYLFTSDDDD